MIKSQAGQRRSTAPFGGADHQGVGLTQPKARL